MPEHQQKTSAGAIEDIVRRLGLLEREVQRLDGGRRLQTLHRAAHDLLPSPQEGMVVIEASDESVWRFSNGQWRELGVGEADTGSIVSIRYMSMTKRLDPWSPGSWQTLDWSIRTIVHTNDVDGTEMSANSADGDIVFAGTNFGIDTTGDATQFTIGGTNGLYFIQYGVDLLGAVGTFDIGVGTQAINGGLIDLYPVTMLRYSAAVGDSAGANRASIAGNRTQYRHSGGGTYTLQAYQNSGATISDFASIMFSMAKVEIT